MLHVEVSVLLRIIIIFILVFFHLGSRLFVLLQVRKAVREAVALVLRASEIVRDGTVEVHPAASVTEKYCTDEIQNLLNNTLVQKTRGTPRTLVGSCCFFLNFVLHSISLMLQHWILICAFLLAKPNLPHVLLKYGSLVVLVKKFHKQGWKNSELF